MNLTYHAIIFFEKFLLDFLHFVTKNDRSVDVLTDLSLPK